jgi:hypothetical protein
MSISEIAAVLGVSKSYLYDLVEEHPAEVPKSKSDLESWSRIQPDPVTYHGQKSAPVPTTVECWDGDANVSAHLLTGDKVTLGTYMRWVWHQRFTLPGDD